MRKVLVVLICVLTGISLLAQQSLIESVFVLNIEVPVRVFHDGKFIT